MKKLYIATYNDIYKKPYMSEDFSDNIYSIIPYEDYQINKVSQKALRDIGFIKKHSIPISDKIYNEIKSYNNRIIGYNKKSFFEKFNLHEWIV